MLWFQSKAVLQVIMGADGGWSTANRGGGRVSFGDAWQASRVMSFAGLLVLVFTAVWSREMLGWLAPIAVPMVISPVLIWASSQNARENGLKWLFRTPNEIKAAPALVARAAILSRWEKHVPELPQFIEAESAMPAAPIAIEAANLHAGA
jgi:membrane glycosyltransferase